MFPSSKMTIDHVIPRTQGGKSSWNNCVLACHECNQKKGSKIWTPTNKPFTPSYYELVSRRLDMPIYAAHESWVPYISIGQKTAKSVQINSHHVAVAKV
jgi:hypothetical protein